MLCYDIKWTRSR